MPGHRTVPTSWVGPVRSHCMPMTISPLDWAWDEPAVKRLPAATISAVAMARNCFIALSLLAHSVRERPDPEVASDVPPETVQTLGLHDQEEDDQGAEHHEAEVGNQVEHRRLTEEDPAERLHRVANDDREQGHEDRAEDRAP